MRGTGGVKRDSVKREACGGREVWAKEVTQYARRNTILITRGTMHVQPYQEADHERSRHHQPAAHRQSAASAARSRPCLPTTWPRSSCSASSPTPASTPGRLDEVIFGNIGQPSEAANIARVAPSTPAFRKHVPAYTVQRNCASGMQAITSAYNAIQAGDGDLYLVGGTENMSLIPYVVKGARWGLKLRHSEFTDALWEGLTDPTCNLIMGGTAENLAEKYRSAARSRTSTPCRATRRRSWPPAWASSRTRSCRSRWSRRPPARKSPRRAITQDESINPGLTVQKAALYPTVFKKDGSVTPANACPMNDGAAAMLVMTAERGREAGPEADGAHPRLRLHGRRPGVHGHWPGDRAAQGAGARRA